MITMSHRPQLRLGGRVACIDLFLVAPEHRHKAIGNDLLVQALRRTEALACKRVEVYLPEARDDRHVFFERYGFLKTAHDLYMRPAPPVVEKK
jgi:GNAT superfamily N-acetyltransferase